MTDSTQDANCARGEVSCTSATAQQAHHGSHVSSMRARATTGDTTRCSPYVSGSAVARTDHEFMTHHIRDQTDHTFSNCTDCTLCSHAGPPRGHRAGDRRHLRSGLQVHGRYRVAHQGRQVWQHRVLGPFQVVRGCSVHVCLHVLRVLCTRQASVPYCSAKVHH